MNIRDWVKEWDQVNNKTFSGNTLEGTLDSGVVDRVLRSVLVKIVVRELAKLAGNELESVWTFFVFIFCVR